MTFLPDIFYLSSEAGKQASSTMTHQPKMLKFIDYIE